MSHAVHPDIKGIRYFSGSDPLKLCADIGNATIEFEVKYRRRKTMSIQIDRTGTVSVFSPMGISEDFIKQQVCSKAKWITSKLKDIAHAAETTAQREFKTGQSFLFLGDTYLLHTAIEKTLQGVFVLDGVLYIRTTRNDKGHIKKLLYKWYRQKAGEVLLQRIEKFIPITGLEPRLVKVKEQKRRWGSCTCSGNIYLNWRLIMAPLAVIDYVVLHELVHLAHHDHSKYFWQKVEKFMPDYRQRKQWLKKNSAALEF
jgi:predicted metal-dependent hydrolase